MEWTASKFPLNDWSAGGDLDAGNRGVLSGGFGARLLPVGIDPADTVEVLLRDLVTTGNDRVTAWGKAENFFGWQYDPSTQGDIATVRFSEEVSYSATGASIAATAGIFITQLTRQTWIYHAGVPVTNDGATRTISATLTASDFSPIFTQGGSLQDPGVYAKPNFSEGLMIFSIGGILTTREAGTLNASLQIHSMALTVSPVPELPASALMASGVLAVAGSVVKRRRR